MWKLSAVKVKTCENSENREVWKKGKAVMDLVSKREPAWSEAATKDEGDFETFSLLVQCPPCPQGRVVSQQMNPAFAYKFKHYDRRFHITFILYTFPFLINLWPIK